jgi:hypothetical protein
MYLERVVLSDVKGFPSADLRFWVEGEDHAGWSVITGNNGSGKTAFLRAIALAMLGPEQYRGALQDLRGWVRYGSDRATISLEVRPDHSYDSTEKGGTPYKNTFWTEVQIVEHEEAPSLSSADIFRKKQKGATNGPWSDATAGWFAVAYGPFRRLYGSSAEASRMMAIPGRPPRFGTLFKEDATLGEGEEWMKALHFRRLEEKQTEERTLTALLSLLRDDFLRQGAIVEEVTSDGLILRDTAGFRMKLEEMSEGYRSVLAMLVDICRHMVAVYGDDIVRTAEDGHRYVDRPGIVLIDEIDAHLHPEWQREVGFWLVRHFPRVQFIVTTHSPLVCAAATDRRIYHLPTLGSGVPFQLRPQDVDRVIAGKPDEILITPAFGLAHTRSPRAVNAQARHALLISKKLALGTLPADEQVELDQLALFVQGDESGDRSVAADSSAVSLTHSAP